MKTLGQPVVILGFLFILIHAVFGQNVYSSNFVALEYTKHTWLSCTYNTCTRQTSCPGLYFTSSEKTRCPGEVFKIYKYISGNIRVGNKIGFYFPRKGEWFSCWNSDCSTSSCPGTPHWYYGFANHQKWSQCVGEVFQIFAYGKNYGDAIENGDAIMLYYPYQRKWVSLHVGHHSAHKLGCPGSILPPPKDRWDACYAEIFYITKI